VLLLLPCSASVHLLLLLPQEGECHAARRLVLQQIALAVAGAQQGQHLLLGQCWLLVLLGVYQPLSHQLQVLALTLVHVCLLLVLLLLLLV
jgi:hypothetical protein